MTHPCRVPLHSISRKIINRAKSLAAELAGGLAAGSQVVLQEWVSMHVFVCVSVYVTLHKRTKNEDRFSESSSSHLILSLFPFAFYLLRQQNK